MEPISRRLFLKLGGAVIATATVPAAWAARAAADTKRGVLGYVSLVGGDGYTRATTQVEWEQAGDGTIQPTDDVWFEPATRDWGVITHAVVGIGNMELIRFDFLVPMAVHLDDTAVVQGLSVELYGGEDG